jgi:CheY-like chemotaxis protein
MERNYDLFERSQDSSLIWHGSVHGLESARRKLQELAKRTTNECFAMYMPTRQIVALLNIAQAGQLRGRRVVFQIAYDEHRLAARAEMLRQNGYEVVSVVGNEAAKVVLSSTQHSDLFIVGHAAPERTRKEMVDWLKARYPHIKILALNSADHRQLTGADYNAILTGPDEWLSIVTAALS